MGKVTVFTSLTLDGIMQAPGRPDEDKVRRPSRIAPPRAMSSPATSPITGSLYGSAQPSWRKPPRVPGLRHVLAQAEGQPFTDAMNNTQKCVASTTLGEPLPWANSTPLKGDVPKAVARIKARPDGDMVVLGSGELVQTLMKHDLIDTSTLLIHPLVLGTGRRLFADGSPMAALRLVHTTTTTTGVIATYQPG